MPPKYFNMDAEHSVLALDHSDEDPMDQLRGRSIAYRIAVEPQQGREVFTLQTLPGTEEPFNGSAGQPLIPWWFKFDVVTAAYPEWNRKVSIGIGIRIIRTGIRV